MKHLRNLLLLTSLFCLSSCYQYQSETADLIVHNAKIYTMDNAFSNAEAMAIKDGKIIAIGPEHEIRNKYYSENMLDAAKRPIYPGFIDPHSHFMNYAKMLGEVKLEGSQSWEEAVERVAKFSKNNSNTWILGRGWDQNLWQIKQFPDNRQLDELFPDKPVLLWRIDGHAAIANSKALELAGISAETKIKGGKIGLKDGKLTGLLLDMAIEKVKNVLPLLNDKEWEQRLAKAETNCFSVGLTSVSEAMMEAEYVRIIEHLQDSGKLQIKIYGMLMPTQENKDRFFKNGPLHTDKLNISAFKYFADGALGSRGAKLKADYSDDVGNSGIFTSDSSYLHQEAEELYAQGFQMATHCIGDKACEMILQMYADVLKSTNDRRWRIEHAQTISPEDIHLFGQYNIIPSVQPTHATSDMKWAVDRLGEVRIKHAYSLKDLLKENGLIALGTDFPIEAIDPLNTFYAAVFRKSKEGEPEGGFLMENALTRVEAIRGMTIWAAIANFEEEQKGSLEVGKAADFVLLDRDIMQVKEEMVLETKVLSTYVNGKKVYSK